MDLLRSAKKRLSTTKVSTSKHMSFHEKYALGEVLGQGAFAQVRIGRERFTKHEFAVKIFDLRQPGYSAVDSDLVRAAKIEVQITAKVGDHPNCIRMFNIFMERNLHYMVLEKCRCSLLDVMRDQPEMLENNLISMLRQALEGLAHCHETRVVHRDVKPENFLLGGECGTILKLCDFGLADILPKKGVLKGVFGTAPYMSPELVALQDYDCKTDVWSFGVVVYLLTFGKYPYEPKVRNADAMKKAILLGKPEPLFGHDQDGIFAGDLLKRDPQMRCTAREALEHQFLNPRASLRRSWTSDTLQAAAKLSRAVSRELTALPDPGKTNDLNDMLDDLQDRSQSLFFIDESTTEEQTPSVVSSDESTLGEQCTLGEDEATEGRILEMVHVLKSAGQMGLKGLGEPAKSSVQMPRQEALCYQTWHEGSEYDGRSTQVPTNETLPELADWVSEHDEEDPYEGEQWDPAQWKV